MPIFRQLFDPGSSTYAYVLGDGDSGEALLIDPVYEQAPRDLALAQELGLRMAFTGDSLLRWKGEALPVAPDSV